MRLLVLVPCQRFLTNLSWIRYLDSHYNLPEEHDETMSTMGQRASRACSPSSTSSPAGRSLRPDYATLADDSSFGMIRDLEHGRDFGLPPPGLSYLSYPHPHSPAIGYSQPTPFPSQADGSWLHPSWASSWSGYPKSLPSCLNQKDFSSCAGSACRSLSLPGSPYASSLEQPLSLCSNAPSASLRGHKFPPYWGQPPGACCGAQRPAESTSGRAAPLWPPYPQANGTCCKSASAEPTGS